MIEPSQIEREACKEKTGKEGEDRPRHRQARDRSGVVCLGEKNAGICALAECVMMLYRMGNLLQRKLDEGCQLALENRAKMERKADDANRVKIEQKGTW